MGLATSTLRAATLRQMLVRRLLKGAVIRTDYCDIFSVALILHTRVVVAIAMDFFGLSNKRIRSDNMT